MLKYKQIWHGIKPTRWLIKFNLTITNFLGDKYHGYFDWIGFVLGIWVRFIYFK